MYLIVFIYLFTYCIYLLYFIIIYKLQRFLKFLSKLITRSIVKTCPFRFLLDYYGDSFDVMFPQFPNHFLPFPMLSPHVSSSVSTIPSGVSTVSPQCFPCFLDFAINLVTFLQGVLLKSPITDPPTHRPLTHRPIDHLLTDQPTAYHELKLKQTRL